MINRLYKYLLSESEVCSYFLSWSTANIQELLTQPVYKRVHDKLTISKFYRKLNINKSLSRIREKKLRSETLQVEQKGDIMVSSAFW